MIFHCPHRPSNWLQPLASLVEETDRQTGRTTSLDRVMGRHAVLGVEIKSARDRQTVVGLGGPDDITDSAAWVISAPLMQARLLR